MINLIKGKKVILVGPAGYLEGQNKGNYIDGFDTVVRLNYATLNGNYKDYGKRTDILYNYLAEDPHGNVDVADATIINSVIKSNVRWVVTTFAKPNFLVRYTHRIKGKVNHILLDRSFFDNIKKDVYNAPNTGIVAINHLLSLGVESLDVVGFDFYHGKYQNGYLNRKGNNDKVHNNFSQIIYLDILARKNNRLKLDGMMQYVISETKKRVSIIIPFKSSDPQRKKILQYSLDRYKKIIPDAEIIVSSDGNDDGWIKGIAVNQGVRKAKGDIILLIDADVVISQNKLLEIIKFADSKHIVCLDGKKIDIDRHSTGEILSGKLNFLDANCEKEIDWGKAVFCMTKDKFIRCKGFNERFNGWGGEDLAFYKTLELYFGKPKFIKGDFYHLWHKPQATRNDYRTNKQNANKKLFNKYKNARTIRDLERIRRNE